MPEVPYLREKFMCSKKKIENFLLQIILRLYFVQKSFCLRKRFMENWLYTLYFVQKKLLKLGLIKTQFSVQHLVPCSSCQMVNFVFETFREIFIINNFYCKKRWHYLNFKIFFPFPSIYQVFWYLKFAIYLNKCR